MSHSSMITFRQEKKVVLQDVPELDQDFAKQIALALLQGDVRVMEVSSHCDSPMSPRFSDELHRYYSDMSRWITEEAELMLPNGITLTIKREVLK